MASWGSYSQHYGELVADIKNKARCVDDTLTWVYTIKESYFQEKQWLDVCGRNGIINLVLVDVKYSTKKSGVATIQRLL